MTPEQRETAIKRAAETAPAIPHDFQAVQDLSDKLTEDYARMVAGPLMADIRRWAKRLSREARKSIRPARKRKGPTRTPRR